MTCTHTSNRQSEQGFTLVELAIVMVIIGLLIGGILKGQELIANAKISSTVSQMKSMDAAYNTFQDKYNAVPGDMTTPDTRLQGCAGACATAGNGNSRIEVPAFGAVPTATSESAVSFAHLSAADLISGIDYADTGSVAFGRNLPAVKAGGGMWVSYSTANLANTGVTAGRHYAILNGDTATPTATSGAINATSAANIDRKLDDGKPNTGSVSALGTNCPTGTGATATYNEALNGTCVMYVRVLN